MELKEYDEIHGLPRIQGEIFCSPFFCSEIHILETFFPAHIDLSKDVISLSHFGKSNFPFSPRLDPPMVSGE